MHFSLITTLEAILLVIALSMDAFVSSFAYGSNKIRIPFASIQTINIVSSLIFGISLLAGAVLKKYIPSWLTTAICFAILFILGIIKLLDCFTKSFLRKHTNLNKEIKFSMLNLKFILNLYANPEEADVDQSKILSPMEAASLAVALSLDGLAVGFGAALGNVNALEVFLYSFIANTVAVMLGCSLGNKVAQKSPCNISWLSGAYLIILAFLKLF